MFTLEQIQAAHGEVISGADFPKYVQSLIKLGITHYESYVCDGHTVYTTVRLICNFRQMLNMLF